MKSNGCVGGAIALAAASVAAIGLLTGYLNVPPAIGVAVAGMVIGTGVARGAFSAAPEARK